MHILAAALLSLILSACGSEESGPAAAVATPESPADTEAAATSAPPEVERPYEEGVDAQAEIDAALTAARGDGKRVLLMFGANWCEWCRRLEWVFRNEASVSQRLASAYHLVHVDTGTRRSNINHDVTMRYGDPLPNGLPCLVVLDAEGSVLHVQETGSLERGDRHDPGLVLGFLDRWANAG